MQLEQHYGLTSYVLENPSVKTYVTAIGGHITAQFDLNGKKIDPFFYNPWWNEDREAIYGTPDYILRGIFFCFPFGLNKPMNGEDRPCHGHVACYTWQYGGSETKDGTTDLTLTMDIPQEHCSVVKNVKINEGEPIVYLSETITGAVGRYPVGFHPTLSIPTEEGSAIVNVSAGAEAWTSPIQIEDYRKGGYSSLVPDYHITDETCVPTVYGENVDLTSQPCIHGFDDIYQYFYKETEEFNYVALTVPSEGYLYFQLKNPVTLPSTMVWTSYKGRHYAPWNGRVDGCIEFSAGAQYFHYGITSAYEDNPMEDRGFRTYAEFDGSAKEFKMLCGCVAVPEDYKGVKNIRRGEGKTIVIEGLDGSCITVPCDVDYLK